MTRILSIVGARPQFVKLAAVERAFEQRRKEGSAIVSTIVHTGQHYDDNMSKVFFSELGIPAPDVNLEVGSGAQGEQTARMLTAIEQHLLAHRPDVVAVYGDTNSTLAGALAASKLHIPVAHIEAGLRSDNRRMPEEINRIATDHLSDLLLAPTTAAINNLTREGLSARTIYCGDVMYDAAMFNVKLSRDRPLPAKSIEPGKYAIATIHRADNTEPDNLRVLLNALNEVAEKHFPVILPLHPRTAKVMSDSLRDWRPHARLHILSPLGYLDMLSATVNARVVITDSGGLQKEAAFLGRPCLTLRDETEWVESVELGVNALVGADASRLPAELDRLARSGGVSAEAAAKVGKLYGNGEASAIIARELIKLAETARARS